MSRQWQDIPLRSGQRNSRALCLTFWVLTGSGAVEVVIDNQLAVCFLKASDAAAAEALLGREFGGPRGDGGQHPDWCIRRLDLKDFQFNDVVGLYFREQRHLYRARELLVNRGLEPLEADVQPTDRFLMERFITGPVRIQGGTPDRDGGYRNPTLSPCEFEPVYRVISLDIETAIRGEQLYSIGALLANSSTGQVEQRRVMMVGEGSDSGSHAWLQFYPDERTLLIAFLAWFQDADPDVVIGWNVINFDLRYLQRRADALGIAFTLGRGRSRPDWRHSRDDSRHFTLTLPGRLVLDGIDTLKSATYQFESFSLESVSREFLGRGKLTEDVANRGETITWQFLHDKPALAAYNLEDCQLVWDIFCRADLFEFATQRARLTGLAMDRYGGSVAAFDNRYLPLLHRRGFVAPMLPREPEGVGSPGGHVMDSEPGLYERVLVLDFKSLYPSIIRTFRVDPLARVVGQKSRGAAANERLKDQLESTAVDRRRFVPGFNGAIFAKSDALLPELIRELWQAREEAKRAGNKAMSQAIKILMNSFYGVLGTPGCRFFDYRLPSSITLRGHQVLTRSRELIEARGHRVIYGDTDSVFVCLDESSGLSTERVEELGHQLARELNRWWSDHLRSEYQLQSFLEIEFETHYRRFFMPTIRGTETGSKKRYAGLVRNAAGADEVVFKGLEAVRSDWTPLARTFQRELYRRVFLDLPYRDYILGILAEIRAGQHDAGLVYRKRIRRPLREYTRNVPPHVQAARKADDWLKASQRDPRYERGGWIEYALTVNGPEPLERRLSRLDYDLLIERQIAPIVDAIVHFKGTSFEEISARQMDMFR